MTEQNSKVTVRIKEVDYDTQFNTGSAVLNRAIGSVAKPIEPEQKVNAAGNAIADGFTGLTAQLSVI